MRPYVAIIADSFREAFASRTLQVLLVLIALILGLLAIPGIRVDQPSRLTVTEVQEPDELGLLLGREGAGGVTLAQQQIRSQLSESTRRLFVEYRQGTTPEKRDAVVKAFVEEFNDRLLDAPIYSAEAWQDVTLPNEALKLLKSPAEELSQDARRRLNRLLLDGALEGYLTPVADSHVYLTYVIDETEFPLPQEGIQTYVQTFVYFLLKWFVGAIGMLAAVIFTATIIPQMFEPGALDLLLSKPISRSGAFLARFFGACAFILLNASLFVVGLWLILGLRHGLWNHRILLVIPVFLLAFTIYFSISAYVGVRWRNPILSIALTLVAWVVTFSLHQIWYWGQMAYLNGQRAAVVLEVDGVPLVARKDGVVERWSSGEWEAVFADTQDSPEVAIQRRTGLMYPMLGPLLVSSGDQPTLVAIEQSGMPGLISRIGHVVTGTQSDNFLRQIGPQASGDTIGIAVNSHPDRFGEVLLLTHRGVQRFRPQGEDGEPAVIEPLGPAGLVLQEPLSAAVAAGSDDVVTFSRGTVRLLTRQEDGQYVVGKEVSVDLAGAVRVAANATQVLLINAEGLIRRLDRQLEPLPGEARLEALPAQIQSVPEGTGFYILDRQRKLSLLSEDGKLSQLPVRGQRDITAFSVTGAGRLLVADRFPRVTAYGPDNKKVEQTWQHHTGFSLAYLWAINPLRTILPKPDELDLLVRNAVGAEDEPIGVSWEDLTREREYVDLWTPVWTSALFVVVVLSWTCWSIERRDF